MTARPYAKETKIIIKMFFKNILKTFGIPNISVAREIVISFKSHFIWLQICLSLFRQYGADKKYIFINKWALMSGRQHALYWKSYRFYFKSNNVPKIYLNLLLLVQTLCILCVMPHIFDRYFGASKITCEMSDFSKRLFSRTIPCSYTHGYDLKPHSIIFSASSAARHA